MYSLAQYLASSRFGGGHTFVRQVYKTLFNRKAQQIAKKTMLNQLREITYRYHNGHMSYFHLIIKRHHLSCIERNKKG